MTRIEAQKIRAALLGTTNALAGEIPQLFPTLDYSGEQIAVGTRICWNEKLYMAAYNTFDRVDTDPDHDINGWLLLDYHNGYRVIPETMITANMFSLNEIGYWNGKYYKSLINNNSWNPTAYPEGWTETTVGD